MNKCINLAGEVAAGRLTKEEVDDLILDMDGQFEFPDQIMGKAKELADEAALAAQIEKRNRLQNIVVERRLLDMARATDAMTGNPSDGIRAVLVGINAPIEGGLRSVDALTSGLMGQWVGGLTADLRRAGLLTQFNKMKGEFERQVARAMYALNDADGPRPDVPSEAMEIAKILVKYQDAARDRQNRAGAYIRKRRGYVVRQTHRPEVMQRRGPDAWKDAVRGRLDFDAMGIPIAKIEDFLDSAYDAIRSGVRLEQQQSDLSKAFKGPGNLAKKDSASRVLVFKSADDWFDYDREFGQGSLRESFMQGLSHAARSTGVMTNMGTNPQAMLDRVVTKLKQDYRGDPAKLKGFDGGVVNLQAALDEVTGDVNIGADSGVARIGMAFRAVQTMAKLGGAWVSALSDVAFVATARAGQGRSIAGAWNDALLAPMEGMSGGEKRAFADLMGVGLEGQLGDFMSRFHAQDQFAGRTAKLMQTFFKLNLLGPWTEANKRGVTFLISRDLARNAGRAFADLPDDMRRMLTTYGFDARKWEVARSAVVEGPDGKTYLMPGEVKGTAGKPFTGLSKGQQDALRDDVRDSLFALLTTEADYAVPSPGARERAIMRRGYRPGTPEGEAARFVGQFKSFGVTAMTKVFGRQIYGTGAATLGEQIGRGVGANMGLIHMIASTTVLGYFVYQAKEILKGREPREPSVDAFIAGMLQGGGLGIYGDYLFGEANRYGGGVLQTLAGPGLGTMAETVELFQKARSAVTGEGQDIRGDALRLVKSNTPFANLFYVKGALDYMLWYHLQEMVNPGYLRRMERRVEREQGQEYWLPPTGIVKTGGGFR